MCVLRAQLPAPREPLSRAIPDQAKGPARPELPPTGCERLSEAAQPASGIQQDSGNAQGVPLTHGCRRQLAPGSDRLLMAAARGASSCDIHRWGGGENSFYPLLWSHD